MRRRHLKLLSLWILLPMLLARAWIPAGFMVSVEAGALQLMFCPAGIVQPTGLQAQQHVHHQGMHHADGVDADAAAHDGDNLTCPFSLVAASVPTEVPYFHGAASDLSDERFDFISAPALRAGPLRADRIRGPPALA